MCLPAKLPADISSEGLGLVPIEVQVEDKCGQKASTICAIEPDAALGQLLHVWAGHFGMEPAQVRFKLDGLVLGTDVTPASLGWSTQACSPYMLLATPSPESSAAAPGSAAASSSEAVSSSASAAAPEPAEDPGESVGGAGEHEHPSPASSAAAPGSAAASSSEDVSSSASAAVPEMPAEDPGKSVGGASKHEHLMWVCRAKEYVQLSYPTKMHRFTSVSFKKIGLEQAKMIGELLLDGLDRGMTEADIRVWKLDLLQEAAGGDVTVRAHE